MNSAEEIYIVLAVAFVFWFTTLIITGVVIVDRLDAILKELRK